MDGLNLWPQLSGGTVLAREPLFFGVKSNERADFRYAALHGEWKLIRTVEQGKAGAALNQWLALHPDGDILSSARPYPGWIPPKD